MTVLKLVPNFPCGNKTAMTGGGRILLGDNKVGGELMLLSIRFQCVGVGNSTGFLIVQQVFKNGVKVA